MQRSNKLGQDLLYKEEKRKEKRGKEEKEKRKYLYVFHYM